MVGWFDLFPVQGDSQESSPAPHFKSINSLVLSLFYGPTLTSVPNFWKNYMSSLVAQVVKRLLTMGETWIWSLGQEDPLEKKMAIHSRTLVGKIPWTEEPGRLQAMQLRRVRHDWATSLSFFHTDLCWQSDGSLFKLLSRFVIAFLPRSKHLLISWLQSPSAVILEPPKIKPVTVSTFLQYLPWSDGARRHDLRCFNCEVKLLSCVWLFATPWTVACQAPPSMGFSRQEYWRGLPFPSPGDLPNPGIEPGSPALQADSLASEPPGKSVHRVAKS